MRALIDYLPPHIRADGEMRAIQDALTAVMSDEWAADRDLRAQIYPQTATWTLRYWEAAYGLASDESQALEQRRSALLAKIRSARTATVEAIRALAAAFTSGRVTVVEHPAEYMYDVIIDSTDNEPGWIEALRSALDAFAPAHLGLGIRLVATGGEAVEYYGAVCVSRSVAYCVTAFEY